MFTSKSRADSQQGFTLIELLVVITIISILMALILPVFGQMRRAARLAAAQQTMKTIVMAMDRYRDDFNEYPPDTDAQAPTGSEVIYKYLCRKLTPTVKTATGATVNAQQTFGPYLDSKDQIVKMDGDSKKFISPLGTEYEYGLLVDADGKKRQYLMIDPGPDKLLGGSLEPSKGFVSSNSDDNHDGLMDDKDNIYSSMQTATSK